MIWQVTFDIHIEAWLAHTHAISYQKIALQGLAGNLDCDSKLQEIVRWNMLLTEECVWVVWPTHCELAHCLQINFTSMGWQRWWHRWNVGHDWGHTEWSVLAHSAQPSVHTPGSNFSGLQVNRIVIDSWLGSTLWILCLRTIYLSIVTNI